MDGWIRRSGVRHVVVDAFVLGLHFGVEVVVGPLVGLRDGGEAVFAALRLVRVVHLRQLAVPEVVGLVWLVGLVGLVGCWCR